MLNEQSLPLILNTDAPNTLIRTPRIQESLSLGAVIFHWGLRVFSIGGKGSQAFG